jgi:hypothetical protein
MVWLHLAHPVFPLVWVPAWWFGLGQTLLVIGFLNYFKELEQPAKSLAIWALITIEVMIMAIICRALGYWEPGSPYGEFWLLGSPGLVFFVFFAAWCSYNWGILFPMGNWPLTKIKHPVWRYIAATLFVCFLAWVVTQFALAVFPKFYHPLETALWEAFTWAYIPTAWTFLICLLFPSEG